jgi:EAL domain-containing protein (putative c-di-GMP-specific phosphodiesterase class I)
LIRVLVADDAPEVLRAIESALVNVGYQVFLASDGSQAISAAHNMAFDVAVVDYAMPPPNGVEVLATIRKLHPACASVLVSGVLDVPVLTEAVNRGDITRILAKPFDSETLVATIAGALQARSEQGKGYLTSLIERKDVELADLDKCLDGLLDLALQPFVEADSRRIVGYEALLRSRHRTLKGPLEVITAAERHAQLHRLGERVIRLALARCKPLEAGMKLFINLHPKELDSTAKLSERLEMLKPYADRVVLEITERSNLSELSEWQSSLDAMRAMGFGVAVDDLGAGYSSLSVLAAIKPEFMKVDMSIVRGIHRDDHKRHLMELLAQFARATGATLIAEGVETEAEAATIVACGAHWMQGFLFGRPKV